MPTRGELLESKLESFKRYLAKVGTPTKVQEIERMNLTKENLLLFAQSHLIPNKNKLDDPASEIIIRVGITDVPQHRDRIKRYLQCFVELLTS